MISNAKLQIIIEAVNKTDGSLQEVKKHLAAIEKQGKKSGTSLTELKSGFELAFGAADKFAKTLKMVYDTAARGAEVEQTRASFDSLGVSLRDLQAASLGTVDEMTLMSSTLALVAGASDNLQGHILQNSPQLLEIAKAANALNPTLGDTAHMYESLALGIKRASPMILDNLGLTIKVGQANEDYAESIGKTVDELTAEEKQIALLNATLEAGNRLIEQAGGSTESATDAYAQLGAATKDLKDDFAALANVGLGPVVKLLADGTRAVVAANDVLGNNKALVQLLTGNYGGLITTLTQARDARVWENEVVDNWNLAAAHSVQLMKDMEPALDDTNAAMATHQQYLADMEERDRALAEAQRAVNDAVYAAETAFLNAAAGLQEMSEAALVRNELELLKAELDSGTISAEDYRDATEALLTEFGILSEAEKLAQQDLEFLRGEFAAGRLTADEFADAVARVKANVDALEDKTINIKYIYTDEDRRSGAGAGASSEGVWGDGNMATGGVSGGGWTLLGEHGPELARLPMGTQVHNTHTTQNTYNLNMTTRASQASVAQDFALMRAMG